MPHIQHNEEPDSRLQRMKKMQSQKRAMLKLRVGRPKRDTYISKEEVTSLVIDLNTKDPVQAVQER